MFTILRLAGWLAGSLAGWLSCWLAGWLAGWLESLGATDAKAWGDSISQHAAACASPGHQVCSVRRILPASEMHSRKNVHHDILTHTWGVRGQLMGVVIFTSMSKPTCSGTLANTCAQTCHDRSTCSASVTQL